MNLLVSKALAEIKKDNPEMFKRLVIKMQESEADHLTSSLLLHALDMNREEASTILLSHADHASKKQIDFTRPHSIEDVLDFLEYTRDITKAHWVKLDSEGKLAKGVDIYALEKSVDQALERDKALFLESDYAQTTHSVKYSDVLRVIEGADNNIRFLTAKLRQTPIKDINPYKVGTALLRTFKDGKTFAAFCHDDGVFTNTGYNSLAIRRNSSIEPFHLSVTELVLTADAKCGGQFGTNPKIDGPFKDFLKIFDGQGDYKTIIASPEFNKLLTEVMNPLTSYNIINGRTSFQKQPSDTQL